ncbi:MAG: secretion system protein [Thermoplasmata archaeon]|nr:MAG: secretion system protein [Thermoplasmata archaeon]RLF65155.1 MAG: secretion system protein [Thermoplasmata archaeon]
MPLSKYQGICYRIFGKRAAKSSQIEYIKRAIERAYMEVRPEAYISYAWMNGIIGGVAGIAFIFIYLFLLPGMGIVLPTKLLIIVIPSPILIGAIAYLVTMMIPESKANSRKKDIDNKLPYALNFLAAMASAGVTPALAFKSLAEQPIYGEVQKEAAWIYRDMSIFNIDIVTALRNAANRTPSIKFQEFIQGAITTVTSGGDLKKYFFAKSEEYMRENRRNQKEFLETLGVLAESYVTVVVAAPLFLIVMVSVMSMVSSGGGGGSSSLLIMYMLTFIMLPLAHLGFAVVISSMSPEV